jgi:hypothetical protein
VQYHFVLHDPQGLLKTAAGLDGVTPAQVALFEGEAPQYYLTLSVFSREDDPCGLAVEWVTYVEGIAARPESIRLDGFSNQPCLDPMSLMTVAADVAQSVADDSLTTVINTPFMQFEAVVDMRLADSVPTSQNALEASERACSLNDVCDEFFYDGQLLLTPMLRANAPAVDLHAIKTPWDEYVDAATVRAGVRLHRAVQGINRWRNVRSFAGDAAVL